MDLFRVFDWDGMSLGRFAGGPLFVPRARQGEGRHDSPEHYGAWYCSRLAISAVAETIRPVRGHALSDSDFVPVTGMIRALVHLHLDDNAELIDLDDPSELLSRHIRPSQVATTRRPVTQAIARSIFRDGATGMSWWSTLDADWTNVTLFHERALSRIAVAAAPRALTTRRPEVREAAERLGIGL